jgi:hypothetical protein
MEDLVIDQPFETSAIQIMSESHHGVIRNITINDSDKALLGIGLDWGSVGPITTVDAEIPRMRRLWEENEIYSTHPHDILIENITVGRLERKVDGNDAGVRCSACHNITIRNVHVKTASSAVAIFGGDFGYEFAPEQHRALAHTGYVVEDISIDRAQYYGIVLNGNADNIYRSRISHGYDALLDPVHPGLVSPSIRRVKLAGSRAPYTRGFYISACSNVQIANADVSGFESGVAIDSWVRSITVSKSTIIDNDVNVDISGATEPPTDVNIEETPAT